MVEDLQCISLKNECVIRFTDESNRYFGDFHRVCIRVTLELPESFNIPDELSRERLKYERLLEKMGVQTANLDKVRSDLINSFLASSRRYLENPDFPLQLLKTLQTENKRKIFLRR